MFVTIGILWSCQEKGKQAEKEESKPIDLTYEYEKLEETRSGFYR